MSRVIATLSPALAQPFSKEKAYTTGEWVLYGNKYYTAKIPKPAGSGWTPAAWELHENALEETVQMKDVERLGSRYTQKDLVAKINEIADILSGRTAVAIAVCCLAWTGLSDVTVQKAKLEDLYNDDYVVTDVSGSSGGDLTPALAYTTAVSNKLENSKQNKLIAGDNITIVNDRISATGGSGGGISESRAREIAQEEAAIAADPKQDKLTAGDNITIINNRISAVGSGFTPSKFALSNVTNEQGAIFVPLASNRSIGSFSTVFDSVRGRPTVVYANGLFFLSGYEGIRVSTDGESWTEITSLRYGHRFEQVVYVNGLYVAVDCADDAIMTSTEGTRWTKVASPASYMHSLAYKNGIFLVGASNSFGTRGVYKSTDGTAWNRVLDIDPGRGIVYCDGHFIVFEEYYDQAQGTYVYRMHTSEDGSTWNVVLIDLSTDLSISNCASDTNIIVARIYPSGLKYSYDGVTWFDVPGMGDAYSSLCFSDGLFLAGSKESGIAYSKDGINWTRNLSQSGDFSAVSAGNGVAVLAKTFKDANFYDYMTVYRASIDSLIPVIQKVRVNGEEIIQDGNNAINLELPTDSITAEQAGDIATNTVNDKVATWAMKGQPAPSGDLTPALAYTTAVSNKLENSKQNRLTAGANITIDENNVISASGGGGGGLTDKLPMSVLTNATGAGFIDLKSRLVEGIGTNVSMRMRFSGTLDDGAKRIGVVNSVVYGNGRYVADSYSSETYQKALIYSSDGLTWKTAETGESEFKTVIFNGNSFIATADDCSIFTSNDGITWTKSSGTVPQSLRQMIYTGSIYYACKGAVFYKGSSYSGLTSVQTPEPASIASILYGSGILLITYSSGNRCYASTNGGSTWTRADIQFASGDGFSAACFYDSKFRIMSWDGHYFTSSDGLTWTEESYTPDKFTTVVAIAGSGGMLVLSDSNNGFFSSQDDGQTWSHIESDPFPYRDTHWCDVLSVANGKFFGTTMDARVGDGIYMSKMESSMDVVPVVQGIKVNGNLVEPDEHNEVNLDITSIILNSIRSGLLRLKIDSNGKVVVDE